MVQRVPTALSGSSELYEPFFCAPTAFSRLFFCAPDTEVVSAAAAERGFAWESPPRCCLQHQGPDVRTKTTPFPPCRDSDLNRGCCGHNAEY